MRWRTLFVMAAIALALSQCAFAQCLADERSYRLRVSVGEIPFEGAVAILNENFTEHFKQIAVKGTFDPASVEVAVADDSCGTRILSQTLTDPNFDSENNALATVYWKTNSVDGWEYYVYFDISENSPNALSPIPFTDWGSISLNDSDRDGLNESFTVQTNSIKLQRQVESNSRINYWYSPEKSFVQRLSDGKKMITGFYFSSRTKNAQGVYEVSEYKNLVDYTTHSEGPLVKKITVNFAKNQLSLSMKEEYRLFPDDGFFEVIYAPDEMKQNTVPDYSERGPFSAAYPNSMDDNGEGDVNYLKTWKTNKTYLIAFDPQTTEAVGMYSKVPTVLRGIVRDSSPYMMQFYDSYGLGAVDSVYRYVFAVGSKERILKYFNWMSSFNKSLEGTLVINSTHFIRSYYVNGDRINFSIYSLFAASGLRCSLTKPDGSFASIDLTKTSDFLWKASRSELISENDPEGGWKISCTGTINDKERKAEHFFRVAHAVHPRLYFTKEEIASIKNKISLNPRLNVAWSIFEKTSLASIVNAQVPNQLPNEFCCREFGEYLESMSIAYQLTGKQQYLDAAKRILATVLNYSDWEAFNNDLRLSHYLQGVSAAYDMLFDQLSQEEKDKIRAKVYSEGKKRFTETIKRIGPTSGPSEQNKCINNHCTIAWSALGVAGEAFNGEFGEAEGWASSTLAAFQKISRDSNADGSSDEGIGYWIYDETNRFFYGTVVERKGVPFFNYQFYKNGSNYRLYGEVPWGYWMNFGDVPSKVIDWGVHLSVLAKITNITESPYIQWRINRILDEIIARGNYFWGWSQEAFFFLWYDPALQEKNPRELLLSKKFPEGGISVMKTGWNVNDTYLAFKCGRLRNGHGHPDQNHFVFFANGSPLVIDEGYSYWKETSAHNTMLFDGEGQDGEFATWPVSKWENMTCVHKELLSNPPFASVSADAAPAYKENLSVQQFERSIDFIDGRLVVVSDEARTSVPRRMEWRFNLPNKTNTEENYAFAKNGNMTVYVVLSESNAYSLSSADMMIVPDLINGVYNDEKLRVKLGNATVLKIDLPTPANEGKLFATFLPLPAGAEPPHVERHSTNGFEGIIEAVGEKKYVVARRKSSDIFYELFKTDASRFHAVENSGNITSFAFHDGSFIKHRGYDLVTSSSPITFSAEKTSEEWSLLVNASQAAEIRVYSTNAIAFSYVPEGLQHTDYDQQTQSVSFDVGAGQTVVRISGAFNEPPAFCGNYACDAGESCSSCLIDCGACPCTNCGGGGGGGSGGGGGVSASTSTTSTSSTTTASSTATTGECNSDETKCVESGAGNYLFKCVAGKWITEKECMAGCTKTGLSGQCKPETSETLLDAYAHALAEVNSLLADAKAAGLNTSAEEANLKKAVQFKNTRNYLNAVEQLSEAKKSLQEKLAKLPPQQFLELSQQRIIGLSGAALALILLAHIHRKRRREQERIQQTNASDVGGGKKSGEW
ncbi:heparinase II/III family protein [Candidatus Micrarchaeota archaeon]|nr:heparinase II/III family protein [Candidatus Micrarchaeota archaeon]